MMRSAAVAIFVLSALALLLEARYFQFSHQKLEKKLNMGRQSQKQSLEQQEEEKKQLVKETEKTQQHQDQPQQ